MNCPNCNQTIPDGLKFCVYCGINLEEAAGSADKANKGNAAQNGTSQDDTNGKSGSVNAVALAASQNAAKAAGKVWNGIKNAAHTVQGDAQSAAAAVKNRSFKDLLKNKTVLCCAALLAAIILIVVISSCVTASASKSRIKGGYYLAKDNLDAVCLYNGAVVKGTDFSSGSSIVATSLDGTIALLQDENELYILKSGKSELISDEYLKGSANISENGKTAAYISDGTLYAYTGGKSSKIADIDTPSGTFPVVSTDGSVVAFTNLDSSGVTGYAWKNGKLIDFETDIIPFSVSKGGKFLFGLDLNGNLLYIKNLKKGSEEKIDSITKITAISIDHTKFLYISEGKTYCYDASINADEGVRITKDVISPLSDFLYNGSVPYIENFNKFYGKENGNLYKYFRKGKSYDDEKIVSNANDLILSQNKKSFVCIDDEGDVMKGDLSNAKNAKKVGKDALYIEANDNLNHVFYLDDDHNIRYAGKDGKIASDVDDFVVTNSGVCVFYDDDNELYYSVKGGNKKKVNLDNIESLEIENDVIYVTSDGELYVSTNGKKFKKTGVEVS